MRTTLALLAALSLTACADTSEIDNAPKASVQEAVEAAPEKPAEEPAEAPAEEAAPEGEAAAEAAPGGTPLDVAQSSIGFLGAKVTGTHDGGFKAFKGGLEIADGAPTALWVEVEMGSLFADHPKLQGHLMSPDFFDVANNAGSGFQATGFEKAEGDNAWNVTGNLMIMNTKKSVTFPATIVTADGTTTADAAFQINRQDFGISYPGKPDDLIKDEVKLTVKLVFPAA